MKRSKVSDYGRRPPRRNAGKQLDAAATVLVEQVRPVFAGQTPEVVGAALGELMTIHLRSHYVLGDPVEQTRMRQDMFNAWCNLVAQLMEMYESEEQPPTIQ